MKRASLNHVYRLVWNERLNAWVAVAENVKARGKKASGALSLAVLMALGLAPAAHALDDAALPTNGQIVAGQGSIGSQGNTLTLNQSSNRLIAQWDTFNIGKNASVVFNQASADSIALNRILDSNPSQIFGSLSANGKVFLVNPSGIVFGQGAQVNVGGLVASSLNISNEDFLAGNLKFSGSDGSGAVINRGSISAAQGGVVALLAPQVTNEGTISADGGSALLAAGNGVSLDFVGDGLISYNIDAGTTRALVQNGGLVQADGGLAVLTAKAADAVNQAVVNNTGTVRARGIAEREGRILLLSDMEHGTTFNDGTLDASATGNAKGGFVETSAANVQIGDNTVVDTRSANGEAGNWLIDPIDYVVAASGGNITGAVLSTNLNTSNVTLDTAGAGGNGDIFINDVIDVTGTYPNGAPGSGRTLTLQADRDIHFNSTITATSGRLNIVAQATRDVLFSADGRVNTNGGNFTFGTPPAAIPNYATATGRHFRMVDGSYINVGGGSLDINVSGEIELAADSLRVTSSEIRYLDSGFTDYNWWNYLRLAAGTSITSSNTNAAVSDITGMADVYLQSGSIGSEANAIKIGRSSWGNSLTVTNTAGNSYVDVLNANAAHGFGSVAVHIGHQVLSTQRLTLGGNSDDHGHILMNTTGSGVLRLLGNDIDTAGTRSNISIAADEITFANHSVDVGRQAFHAHAGSMLGDGTDGVAEVIGGSVSFTGADLGSLARRLEVAGGDILGGANALHYYNTGGDTFITSVDNSFTSVNMTNVKDVGTHSVLFATDHIDYTTDGTGVLLPTITVSAGADVRARNRSISFTTHSGDIRFETDSVNTGAGSLAAVISSVNDDGAAGNVIRAVDAKDGQAEITTGNASFSVYRPGTGAISDIEIAQGVNAGNNWLTVSTYGGDVDLTELDSHHFKTLSVTLQGAHESGQSVRFDLNGADDVSFTDGANLLTLDDTKLALTDFDRNWSLTAYERDVQIDSVDLGSGNYSVYSENLLLNGDVMTDGGGISLNTTANNINLMRSVRIDSNADDDANSTSEGLAGHINLYGNISAGATGRTLTVDASSTTQPGGSVTFHGDLGNGNGAFLSGASFTTKGSTDLTDGSLNLWGTSFLLDGDFSAIGNTHLYSSFSDVLFDTEQGNDGSAGNITFGGGGLRTSQYTGYTFNASTNAVGGNGGNVDLDTLDHSGLEAKSLTVTANAGSAGATAGNIDLPAVNTAAAGLYYNGTTTNQSYTGNIITLHGNLSTNGGNVTLDGDTRLAQSVAIKTSIANPTTNAGSVIFGANASATAPGQNLTIDTSTNTSDAYNAGSVVLRTGTAGGANINNLSIDARARGAGGSSSTITLANATETTGNQTYASHTISTQRLSTPGAISITTASGESTTINSLVQAGGLALRGGTFSFGHNSNQVNTLAANSGRMDFVNSGALAIGSVDGIDGITSTGTVTVATWNGDLTLANSVSSSATTADAIQLIAGALTPAGTITGGNILVNNGVSVTTGTGGRATLYTGGIDGSTGLTDLVGFGSGKFRYNSTFDTAGYTAGLGDGVYAIYREAPTISVSVDDISTVYGSAPTLTTTFVNGRNGDAGSNFTYSVGDGDSSTADGAQSSSGNYIVGMHSITATSSSGAAELGYNVTGTSSGTLTVTAKELTVSGITAAGRTYDGTTDATVDASHASVSGILIGDLVGQDYSNITGTFDDKNVGTGKHISVNGITFNGADAGNYTLAGGVGSGTGNITARTLDVGFTGVNRVYDGTTNASVISNDNRIGNDVLTINRTASFGDKNVGTGKDIYVSNISLGGADAGNYVLGSVGNSATGDISVRTLNIGFTGTNRTYDGTTTIQVTSHDDRVHGDVLSIDQTAALGDKNAGTGKLVNISNITLGGTDAGNYSLGSTTGTTTADIGARSLNLTYTGNDRQFDGTPRATVTIGDNRVDGDSLSFNVNARYTDFTVGDNREVLINGVTLGGADAGNYIIVNPTGNTTANIEPGPISNHILASITSPQAAINGTSSHNTIYTKQISIGAGSGSNTMLQNINNIIFDARSVTLQGGLTLNLSSSTHSIILSKIGPASTLSIDAPAKIAESSGALPLFEARSTTIQPSGNVEFVDSGNTLSVSPTGGSAANIQFNTKSVGKPASGEIVLPGGQKIVLDAAVNSDKVLSITLPKDAPALDNNDVAALGATIAVQQLKVKTKELKAIVIQKR